MAFEQDPEMRELADASRQAETFISPLLGDSTRPEYVESIFKLEIGAQIIHALTGWRPPTPPGL